MINYKTESALICAITLCSLNSNYKIAFCVSTESLLEEVRKRCKELLENISEEVDDLSYKLIRFKNKSELRFYSLESKRAKAGLRFDSLIVDSWPVDCEDELYLKRGLCCALKPNKDIVVLNDSEKKND
jgi:KaiC/GvpD/RAD55 family RecA-like ATPase